MSPGGELAKDKWRHPALGHNTMYNRDIHMANPLGINLQILYAQHEELFRWDAL